MKKNIKLFFVIVISLLVLVGYFLFNIKRNINRVYPCVVHITAKTEKTTSSASGIVYNIKEGKQFILTSYHVIKGYVDIKVYDENLNEEKAYIENYDEESDLAILSIKNTLKVKKASFDVNKNISKKEKVYVLTSFLDKTSSYIVKDGIIKLNNKKISLNNNKFNVISINYNIEEGDSGSPVINKKGKVIGMIFLQNKEKSNIGYAHPSNIILKKVKELEDKKNILNLGAAMTSSKNIQLLDEYNITTENKNGVVILFVKDKYPLSNAGLQKGDIIVKFNKKQIDDVKDLKQEITKLKTNQKVLIEYYRNNELIKTSIKLDK